MKIKSLIIFTLTMSCLISKAGVLKNVLPVGSNITVAEDIIIPANWEYLPFKSVSPTSLSINRSIEKYIPTNSFFYIDGTTDICGIKDLYGENSDSDRKLETGRKFQVREVEENRSGNAQITSADYKVVELLPDGREKASSISFYCQPKLSCKKGTVRGYGSNPNSSYNDCYIKSFNRGDLLRVFGNKISIQFGEIPSI